jgi:Holliday junction DNA helicase RuvA
MKLKSVSGIGPKSALNILSGSSASNLINSILSEDVKSLTLLPGLGPKTAKRIILELKEKLADKSNEVSSSNSFDNQVLNDARNALISLGYKLKDVNDVISNEYKSKVSNDSLEEIIRKILKKLVK